MPSVDYAAPLALARLAALYEQAGHVESVDSLQPLYLREPSIPTHLRLQFRPMTLSDIDDVMLLEHQSFADPWPRSLYVREVKEGRYSHHYIVETDTPDVDPPILVGHPRCGIRCSQRKRTSSQLP